MVKRFFYLEFCVLCPIYVFLNKLLRVGWYYRSLSMCSFCSKIDNAIYVILRRDVKMKKVINFSLHIMKGVLIQLNVYNLSKSFDTKSRYMLYCF